MNKAELISNIQSARADLDSLLADVSESEFTQRLNNTDWSLKDTMAHLTFWQQSMVSNLKRLLRNETGEFVSGELDDINMQVYAANQSRPLKLVMDEFQRCYEELFEVLPEFSDEEITAPNQFSFRQGQPLWEHIWGESGEHYRDHFGAIREILARIRVG